ncbi:peroxidase-related enzyme [Roseomonas xinghualingensis]|uniref:peroxidase-related enzyme n=1 Tax=Roseomonas xinghualingensis TaxID=2986475 RepID=UPI0021F1228F|nr:peroxidase-related enzyme [Roseomonas sp. SXEYE001]MCV4209511.1 peroxidase-related enzyme [Roseomonas sp. SXEYE001]
MANAAPRPFRYPVPELGELPEDIRARILAVQEKAGFVPNVFLLLARRPDEFRAFVAYHDALMEKREGLTAAEREMIVVAVSAAHSCQYCVVAHGAILRVRAKDPVVADLVATNYRKAGLPARQRAMLDYALKVATQSHLVEEEDHKALAKAGFTEDEAWDIGAIAAFFSMSNRLANATDLRPNPEFHMLGRK